MKGNLQKLLTEILKDIGVTDVVPDVSISEDPTHGEYATNIAMRLAKQLKKSPMEIALQVKEAISRQSSVIRQEEHDQKMSKQDQKKSEKTRTNDVLQAIDRVEVAPPGFVNIFLSESALGSQLTQVLKTGESYGTGASGKGKKLMVEFTDPNPFKEFHMGHLYSNAVGESLARLYEANGWGVVRSDYFGDVGMHVAKSIWGLRKQMAEDHLTLLDLEKKPLSARAQYLGTSYSLGATIYEEKTPEAEQAKEEMKDINYMVYLAAQEYMQQTLNWQPQVDYKQHVKVEDSAYKEVKVLFETGRKWSMDYFETIFRRLGTHFDAYYPESIVGEYGAKLVREHLGRVFEESDGAVVFRGESSKAGLHTRVFLNSLGLPTYEAKELGLNWKKSQDYQLDRSFIVTGNEINEYFHVLFAAMEQVIPDVAAKTKHIGHGMVRNPDGSKMSSRKGNVLTGEGLLDEVKESIYTIIDKSKSDYTEVDREEIAEKAAVAAVKYSLLRVALPSNVAFSLSTSVSFDGDSGPYLLYTYARCKSVLRKAQREGISGIVDRRSEKTKVRTPHTTYDYPSTTSFNPEEKLLARAIFFFPELVAEAAENLSPNVLCSYLFKLAQSFNLFYQKHPILQSSVVSRQSSDQSDDRKLIAESSFRLALTAATAQVLKNGLYLLGISTVERM